MLSNGKDTYIHSLPLHTSSENPTGFTFGQLKRVTRLSHSWVLWFVKDESGTKTKVILDLVHEEFLCKVYVELR